MKKVSMYIDGFNFYYAIRDNKPDLMGLGWCDFRKLAEQFMREENSELHQIKYFTAMVGNTARLNSDERERQRHWMSAVRTISGLDVIEGFYQQPDLHKGRVEKQTDVNIAVELVLDAMDGLYDHAILVTGDIDLAPAVKSVHERMNKPGAVTVWVPPYISHKNWDRAGKECGAKVCQITEDQLRVSRLKDVIKTDSVAIRCPDFWKLPKG